MVWFEVMALLSRVFQKLFKGENGLYITEFEGTFIVRVKVRVSGTV